MLNDYISIAITDPYTNEKKSVEVMMSYALVSELLSVTRNNGDESVLRGNLDPQIQHSFMTSFLCRVHQALGHPRDTFFTDGVDIHDKYFSSLTMKETNNIIVWMSEHLADFLSQRLENSAKLMKEMKAKIQKSNPDLIPDGSPASKKPKPSA